MSRNGRRLAQALDAAAASDRRPSGLGDDELLVIADELARAARTFDVGGVRYQGSSALRTGGETLPTLFRNGVALCTDSQLYAPPAAAVLDQFAAELPAAIESAIRAAGGTRMLAVPAPDVDAMRAELTVGGAIEPTADALALLIRNARVPRVIAGRQSDTPSEYSVENAAGGVPRLVRTPRGGSVRAAFVTRTDLLPSGTVSATAADVAALIRDTPEIAQTVTSITQTEVDAIRRLADDAAAQRDAAVASVVDGARFARDSTFRMFNGLVDVGSDGSVTVLPDGESRALPLDSYPQMRGAQKREVARRLADVADGIATVIVRRTAEAIGLGDGDPSGRDIRAVRDVLGAAAGSETGSRRLASAVVDAAGGAIPSVTKGFLGRTSVAVRRTGYGTVIESVDSFGLRGVNDRKDIQRVVDATREAQAKTLKAARKAGIEI